MRPQVFSRYRSPAGREIWHQTYKPIRWRKSHSGQQQKWGAVRFYDNIVFYTFIRWINVDISLLGNIPPATKVIVNVKYPRTDKKLWRFGFHQFLRIVVSVLDFQIIMAGFSHRSLLFKGLVLENSADSGNPPSSRPQREWTRDESCRCDTCQVSKSPLESDPTRK